MGVGRYRISVNISMTPLGVIFRAKIDLFMLYLVLKMAENCEKSSAIKELIFKKVIFQRGSVTW